MAIGRYQVTMWPTNSALITPNDDTTFTSPTTLLVREAGTVVYTPFGGGTDVSFVISAAMVANGPYEIPRMVSAVKATGTTGGLTILGGW